MESIVAVSIEQPSPDRQKYGNILLAKNARAVSLALCIFFQYQTTSDWQDRGGGGDRELFVRGACFNQWEIFRSYCAVGKRMELATNYFRFASFDKKKETRESVVVFCLLAAES